jgi:type I restriction enzyme M protein
LPRSTVKFPDVVPDRVMSNIYEHLIRRFGAEVNEGAEDFMTPRDIVHLATALLLDPDDALFEASPGLIRTCMTRPVARVASSPMP